MDGIGSIDLTESSEVVFYVDTYKRSKFGNIRKFVKSKKYTGPTKSGVKLSKEQLAAVCRSLDKVSGDLENLSEGDLATIPVSETRFISVSITYFNGTYGLDIRQHIKTDKYTGPTKKGVRIPIDHLGDAFRYCEEMLAALGNQEKETPLNEDNQEANKTTFRGRTRSVNGVPDEYTKYFQ